MADDSFGFHVKATMLRSAVRFFQSTAPSKRELAIQIDNLEKLAEKFDKKFTMAFVLSTPRETYRQKKASDLHRLTLQSKHVDDLFARMIEEFLQQMYPDVIPVKRKSFKMRGRQFVAGYNRQIKEDVKTLRAGIEERALAEFSASELDSFQGKR